MDTHRTPRRRRVTRLAVIAEDASRLRLVRPCRSAPAQQALPDDRLVELLRTLLRL